MNGFTLATSLEPSGSPVFTVTVVIAGIGIVLGTLALLIVLFSLFGKLIHASEKRAAKKKDTPPHALSDAAKRFPDISEMPPAEPLPPADPAENGIAPEVVAAITAAVQMLAGEEAQVTAIQPKPVRRQTENAWHRAAIIENVKPF